MENIVNDQAAGMDIPPNNQSAPDDVTTIENKYKIPILFLREKEIFGDRRPERNEWIQHVELYRAIGTKINVAHIAGLQRVRGLWRIYLDNIQDKVTLMAEGVTIRGKNIPLLNTNPDRFDGEMTTRVRIKNIPLSVDDGLIKRTITLKEAEVISIYREKLRVDGKLTNCETGDRIVIVKSSSLKEPLPISMAFGQFTGRVLHPGQQKPEKHVQQKCTKCLQDGHTFGNCTNEWVCSTCGKSGHKRIDCRKEESDIEESDDSDSESSSSELSDDDTKTKPTHKDKPLKEQKDKNVASTTKKKESKKSKRVKSPGKTQQSIDRYVTPQKDKTISAKDRSPPTPAEELHDKQLAGNRKKQKK